MITRSTLYTELGIPETASHAEIKSAYLRKAIENHPDKVEETNRETADERMSRLNQVIQILGDEQRREDYDAGLAQQRAEEESGIRAASAIALQAWQAERRRGQTFRYARFGLFACLAGIAVLGGIAFHFLGEHRSGPVARVTPVAPPSIEHKISGEIKIRSTPREPVGVSSPPTELRENPAETVSDAPADPQPNPLLEEARQALERGDRPSRAAPLAPGEADPKTDAVQPPPPETVQPDGAGGRPPLDPWSGLWAYFPGPGGSPGGEFAPLSIDLNIEVDGLTIRGNYRAQYVVNSENYSGNVQFALVGLPNREGVIQGSWHDPDGAKGEFKMTKVEPKVIEFSWWTTVSGRAKALASGSARLAEKGR